MNPGAQSEKGESPLERRDTLLDEGFLTELQQLSALFARSQGGRAEPRRLASLRVPRIKKLTARPSARGSFGRRGGVEAALGVFFQRILQSRSRQLILLVDASESMERTSQASGCRKFDQARKIAVALGVVAPSRFDRVRIAGLGHARGRRSPVLPAHLPAAQTSVAPAATNSDGKSPQELPPLFHFARSLRPGGKRSFISALRRQLEGIPATSACVLVSDFHSPDWEVAIPILLGYAGLSLFLVHVVDPSELQPQNAFEVPLQFVDPVEKLSRSLRPLRRNVPLPETIPSSVPMSAQTPEWAGLADLRKIEGLHYIQITTDQPFERALIKALKSKRAIEI